MRRPLNENVFALLVLFVAGLVVVSAWDERDLAALKEHARDTAVKLVVEEAGHRAPFMSEFHCRAPLKGERLVMQHAASHDAGRGYRCTYYMVMDRGAPRVAFTTFSRAPEAAFAQAYGGGR